ncbi:hypothetical protein KQX54_013523 [Cotesia glomerata]|uniref:C2H2-type domain-containing protein n=1 Tax=Cotesia glomerata TaxID=32391 RepID=A0AAV7ISK1_COTGL|nr:hypothetical protein KQX54_013523 [Cotesia glomerata]
MLELFGSASPGPRQWKGLDKPNEQTRQEPKTKRLQRPEISIAENRMLPGKIRIVPVPEPYDPTNPGFVWTRPRKLQPPTETVEEEARLLEEILITKEPETIHSAVHSDLRDEQSPCQGNPLTITTAVTSKVACLPSWVRHDDAPLLMDYPDEFEDKPGDLFKRPRKRPPQTLEQLLATLTPLDQVRSQPFLPHQKRRRFKAYDQELRLYQLQALNCSLCNERVQGALNGLISYHLVYIHGFSLNRKISNEGFRCGQDGCGRRFCHFFTLRRHIRQYHINNDQNIEDEEDMGNDEAVDEFQPEGINEQDYEDQP